ncbi:HNH endonuclease domain-containing protein [Roseburia sp. AF20-18LB]|uniref:HNH endonuclease domain-containing protein n=1 Tax=Roseburia sp. AF20-18LB TaxID=2293129 RepID=UPI0018F4103F|nr:HNH endonuclease domain-containing protein [Roseburia sp. AF20-18LB]
MAELIIDSNYYNKLDIEGFSKMMSSPSYCYKFYWLEAIVQLISANRTEATYDEIINKMIANAWFPVQEYHIHLSGIYGDGDVKDNLEKAVSRLYELTQLPSNANEIQIMNKLAEFSNDKELHSYKTELTKNVPYKALSGFANKGTEKINLESSAGRMIAYYNKLSGSELLLPYTFGDEKSLKKVVKFNDGWIQMIQDNMVSILGWIKYEKVKWLQNNNPEVPGIVYKLAQDDEKARKLDNVRKLWDAILEIRPVKNVFMDGDINGESYAVDHFIPRNFVMNDELWNLMPMDPIQNMKKNKKLPVWENYFGQFANNQFMMYEMIFEKPELLKLYKQCYKDNLHSIWAIQELYRKGNSADEFRNILDKNMHPVYDSARRQGYDIWDVS